MIMFLIKTGLECLKTTKGTYRNVCDCLAERSYTMLFSRVRKWHSSVFTLKKKAIILRKRKKQKFSPTVMERLRSKGKCGFRVFAP